MDTVPNKCD